MHKGRIKGATRYQCHRFSVRPQSTATGEEEVSAATPNVFVVALSLPKVGRRSPAVSAFEAA